MLTVAERALSAVQAGNHGKWLEVGELALKTLSTWTREFLTPPMTYGSCIKLTCPAWVELSVTLNPQTLAFYQRLLSQNVTSFRAAAAGIIRTLIAKGQKDPSDKLQVLNVLDIVNLLDPLEASTRGGNDEIIGFRVALGSILAAYGTELVELWDNDENPEAIRREAESRIDAARSLLLRFMADAHHEVPHATNPFVSDLLRVVSLPYSDTC